MDNPRNPRLERARRFVLALLPALALAAPALASSHREAPAISNDPVADNTDVYFFRDPVDPSRLVMISNWNPLEEPAGGPNFHHFESGIRFELNVDSNGDAIEDYVYRFEFTRNVNNPNTFLQNGVVNTLGEDTQNVFYTYSVKKCLGPSPNQATCTELGNELLEAPANVGPKSFPNGYSGNATNIAGAVYTIDDSTKVFAGPRSEGFYVDLGMIFDLIHFRTGTGVGNIGGGKNETAGFNVHTIAVSVPIQNLTNNHTVPADPADPNAIVSMWTSTWRPKTTTLSGTGSGPITSGSWVQVSRLGNPLINEVVIPLGMKDVFNATYPVDDLANFGTYVLNSELAGIINALFGIPVPPNPRTDLLVLVEGLAGLTKRPGEVISDQLRLNTAIYPTPVWAINRLGVLAGDTSGFPNGRRPHDDVVDIALRVVAGVLVPDYNVAPNNQLGDGIDGPDVPYIAGFPYLWTPHSGYTHLHDENNVPVYNYQYPDSQAALQAPPVE